MNSVENHFLYISDNEGTTALTKFCLEFSTKSGNYVLLLTQNELNVASIYNEMEMDKFALNRFIVMTFSKLTDLIAKLLQLHDWKHVPSIIIIDLRKYIKSYKKPANEIPADNDESAETTSLFMQLSFCIATLYNYLNSARHKLTHETGDASPAPTSLVMLSENVPCDFGAKQLQLLVNLYYYNGGAYNDYSALMTDLKHKLAANPVE